MTIPIIKNYYVADLNTMNRLTLKKIFEGLTYFEETLLEDSIKIWAQNKWLPPTYKRELKVIIDALIKNEDGGFDRTKETFKRCEVDYKRAYKDGL